jgi:NAD(P)-dependent dehydrogenase (short-subunit alcohol dehydrogenase family)
MQDNVVVITGGGQGIGAATALMFLKLGAIVCVMDLDCSALAKQIESDEVCAERYLFHSADCTDLEQMESFFAQVQAKFGRVHTLFNNVGQSARERSGPFLESVEETWRFVLEVSLVTTMRASRLVGQSMKDAGRGRIINMSSDAAFVGDRGLAEYSAAKMGVIGFTRSLARELAPHGVTVNTVCPGAIRTRAHDLLKPEILTKIAADTPAGFIGSPDDVASTVVFLASDGARFITGQTLLIDGGRWMI